MKKLIYFAVCLAVIAMQACVMDLEPEVSQTKPDSAIAINIRGYIDQVVATRVNDDGFCDGDGFGLFAVNYEGGMPGTLLNKGNQVNNVRYVFNEQENVWTPDYPVYYHDNITPVDIIGYYPYNGALENVKNYNFEVQQDQSTTIETALMSGYEASDFLWGKVENVQPTSERINIKFNHAMAGVQVELKEGTGWLDGEWASVKKHVLVANTVRRASIDLATGVVTPVGEREVADIVPSGNGEYYRAVVVPQTLDASMALLRITVDGTPRVFRKNEAFEYQEGKLHKFTISVSKKELSGVELSLVDEEIAPWESETISHDGAAREYVVINVPKIIKDKSALELAIKEEGLDPARILNMKVIGQLNPQDISYMQSKSMASLTNLNLEDVVLYDYDGNRSNKIPNSAFSNPSYNKLMRIILPKSTEIIGTSAFSSCTNIVYINIPDGVTKIEDSAFNNALSPGVNITLPSSLVYIGTRAFSDCKASFKNFQLPLGLKTIRGAAFQNVKLDTEIILPSELESIGDNAFSGTGLKGTLKIPNKIIEIGNYAFQNCNFTGNLVLPDGLISIGNGSFDNSGFSGELIIPEGVVRIGDYAFRNCRFTGQLVLPSSLQYVGTSAFSFKPNTDYTVTSGTLEFPDCVSEINLNSYPQNVSKIIFHAGVTKISGKTSGRHLKEVVCKSKVPPTLSANCFENTSLGNNKENMYRLVNIQVPEESLYKYQTASYWKDYIPSVYRDFNLDLESTSALNAKHSRKMIVRAPGDMEWSVTHKPDWVTVTPSDGVGKVEVTISFDEMARGNGNRTDSLVFKPTGYDYYKSVKVDQYDYPYGSGDVIINQTASVGNGVNIVFMGDCFDAKDIAEGYYEDIMNEAIGYFFAIEPYTTYREYFNVYTVVCHSADRGLPTTHTINREVIFDSRYSFGGLGFQFKINEEKCLEYACKAPTVTKENLCQTPVVVIENSNEYGGVTYLWRDDTSLSVQCIQRSEYPLDFRGVIQHEVGGHAFGKLLDEYVYHGDFADMCTCTCCEHEDDLRLRQSLGWGKNLSLNSNHYEVPWSHMIFDPQYSGYVEIYEGGFFHQRGVYRSEPNSCMNNNVPYYSAISRQAIVERIMKYAGEEFRFENFKAKDSDEIGAIPMSMTRCVATEAESYNPLHNEPVIMGDKPALNF